MQLALPYNPAAFQRQVRSDAHTMQQLMQNNAEMAQAILAPDTSALQVGLRTGFDWPRHCMTEWV